jgi:hypothetical protein
MRATKSTERHTSNRSDGVAADRLPPLVAPRPPFLPPLGEGHSDQIRLDQADERALDRAWAVVAGRRQGRSSEAARADGHPVPAAR